MEAEIKFEREKLDGLVAVGTYLFDAAQRLGVRLEDECGRRGECDSCAVRVKSGGEFLSEITEKEKEQLTAKRRKNGERLACQAKVVAAGEIVIMTHKKKEEEKPEFEAKREEYRKQFEELPLEKKISSLLELEAVALSETLSFVVNSPSHIVGKIMDVMAEFGFRLDEREKDARRPKEHKNGSEKAENGDGAKTQSEASSEESVSEDANEITEDETSADGETEAASE